MITSLNVICSPPPPPPSSFTPDQNHHGYNRYRMHFVNLLHARPHKWSDCELQRGTRDIRKIIDCGMATLDMNVE